MRPTELAASPPAEVTGSFADLVLKIRARGALRPIDRWDSGILVSMSSLDPRTPVLVGVGTARTDAEAAELMAMAAESAAADAGSSTSLLSSVDRICVPQGTWSYPDPGRLVAARIGARGAATCLARLGVPQQTLINDGLRAIAAGHVEVVLVVGGEARARARRAEKAGTVAAETAQNGAVPDVVMDREDDFISRPEIDVGLTQPVLQYALIENALGAAENERTDDHRMSIAELWERFNVVARSNPDAAFPGALSAAELATASPENRPLAFPYNKWHASQWTVDQAAALVLCSVEAARFHNIPADRWVFPLVGIDATHAVSLSRRRQLHRWPAMGVLGRAAAEHIGRPLDAVELVELYSCFPAAVRVQQRELGLPLAGTPTVTGGMAFAGGPFNNFVYQAVADMVPLLRAQPASLGLVSTVCGLLTKPGLALWSATPGGAPPLLSDLASEAAASTGQVEVAEEHNGPATVASCTVSYRGMEPARTFVVADIEPGRRCVAWSDAPALAESVVTGDLIGTDVHVAGKEIRT
jgi:acetyl-CoA C-acetyltransferase